MAFLQRMRAAGMETATGLRGLGRRRLASKPRRGTFALTSRIGQRNGFEQGAGVGVSRGFKDGARRPDLDDSSQIHDGNAMREMAHNGEIVRDEQHCQPSPLAKPGKEVEDTRLNRHIESRNRFIGDEQTRP